MKLPFDPVTFLGKVGAGKTILNYQRNQTVFEQGDVADTVFYLQKGRIKLTVISEQGKEAVIGILEPTQFFGEECLNGHPIRIAMTTAMVHAGPLRNSLQRNGRAVRSNVSRKNALIRRSSINNRD